MSAIDNGRQILTFDFRQEATSINFNRYNANIIKPGIYKGGRVSYQQSIVSGQTLYNYVIEPFSAAFLTSDNTTGAEVNTKLLVNVITNDSATFNSAAPNLDNSSNITSGVPGLGIDYYLTISLDWVKSVNNYINFSILTDVSQLSSNQLILCRIRGNGNGKKPDIFYDFTSYGSFYESFDDKFTSFNNGVNTLSSNYGQYITDPNSPRRLIPFTSNSYYLKFNGWTSSDKYAFFTFQPFNGELEMINKDNYREKIKFIFNTDKDINIISTPKVNLVNSGSRVVDSISFNVDTYGRLTIINGYTSAREYIIKTDIVNNSRRLNTVTSLV